MKRILFALVMIVMAVGVNAQTTWNLRAGAGSSYDSDGYGCFTPCLSLQTNIPLSAASKYTVSPTLTVAAPDMDIDIILPVYFGYKTILGNQALFVPKIGPCVGYSTTNGSFVAGPAAELAVEIKHFVIGVNGYYSLTSDSYDYGYGYDAEFNHYGAFFTLGYKF